MRNIFNVQTNDSFRLIIMSLNRQCFENLLKKIEKLCVTINFNCTLVLYSLLKFKYEKL
jgi:hypothetical protein